jgi:hypothetical protein
MNDFEVLDVRFTFRRRPLDLPGDLRPNWRVPLLVLMLRVSCRGGKSSLFKLHLLNWTIREDERQAALLRNIGDSPDYSEIGFQVEPSFVKAIQLAVGEGLIERLSKSRVRITEKGRQFATDILGSHCLAEEKAFLENLGVRLAEKWVVGFGMRSKVS